MYKLTNLTNEYIKRFKKNNIDYPYLEKVYNIFEKYISNNIKYSNNCILNYDIFNFNNRFISNIVIKNIDKLHNKCIVKFNINNNLIQLDIYHNEKNIDKFIETLIIYINFMYNISNYNGDLKIKYYLTNCKKTLSKNILKNRNHIFTENEINTGITSNNLIIIWRKEEVLKTTIHELLHYMNLDYRDTDNNLNEYYNNIYNSNSNINSFEAYTDYWAIIINAYLSTKLLNKSYKFFKDIITIEINHTLYQCHKILYLSRKNNNKIIDFNKYTNIIPYYFIKCSLFLSLNDTLKYFINNNNNLFKIIDINKYYNYLKTLNIIKPNSKRFNNNIILSMRMSICELELFT